MRHGLLGTVLAAVASGSMASPLGARPSHQGLSISRASD